MLDKFTKLTLAAFTTLAFAGTAMADHHDEVMDDACAAADDMMEDACSSADDMMGDACSAAGDGMDDVNSNGDDGMVAEHLGKLEIDVSVPISINGGDNSSNSISISPDIWYGVNDKLRVGLVHSAFGTTNFWYQPRTSLCVSGDACGDVYTNGGLRALYTVSQSDAMKLQADVGILAGAIDPFALQARLGIKGSAMMGKLMTGFNPAIHVGLTERDGLGADVVAVPVDVGYMVMPKLWAGVQSGISAPLDGFGENYTIPFNLGAMYSVNHNISAGATFGFDNLAGKNGGADARGINLMFAYKL